MCRGLHCLDCRLLSSLWLPVALPVFVLQLRMRWMMLMLVCVSRPVLRVPGLLIVRLLVMLAEAVVLLPPW